MTHQTTLRIGKQARALAAALAIGATVLSLLAAPAHAEKNQGSGGGAKCVYHLSDGDVLYKDEGSRVFDRFSGTWKTCKDGQWVREGTSETPRATLPGGGVYAP